MTSGDEHRKMAEKHGRLSLMIDIPLIADKDGGRCHVYVEQGGVGQDNASLIFSNGESVYTLCFLSAENLDRIAMFLTESAHQLRKMS